MHNKLPLIIGAMLLHNILFWIILTPLVLTFFSLMLLISAVVQYFVRKMIKAMRGLSTTILTNLVVLNFT